MIFVSFFQTLTSVYRVLVRMAERVWIWWMATGVNVRKLGREATVSLVSTYMCNCVSTFLPKIEYTCEFHPCRKPEDTSENENMMLKEHVAMKWFSRILSK